MKVISLLNHQTLAKILYGMVKRNLKCLKAHYLDSIYSLFNKDLKKSTKCFRTCLKITQLHLMNFVLRKRICLAEVIWKQIKKEVRQLVNCIHITICLTIHQQIITPKVLKKLKIMTKRFMLHKTSILVKKYYILIKKLAMNNINQLLDLDFLKLSIT